MRSAITFLAWFALATAVHADAGLLAAARTFRPDIDWIESSRVSADFDCDGQKDLAIVGRGPHEVVLAVFRGGKGGRPDAVAWPATRFVGQSLSLSIERLDVSDADFQQMTGRKPDGYRRSSRCFGLQLTDGEKDAVHLYWYRKRNEFGVWSL
jgi:hypothetical protein